jgi:hypothetical protein
MGGESSAIFIWAPSAVIPDAAKRQSGIHNHK